MTQISVILPTLNEEGTIRRAIESAWNAGAHQVIVADGGSQDRTSEIANESGAVVVSSNRGRGTQLATGCLEATGDILVMLHADSLLSKNAFDAFRELDEHLSWGCFRQRIDSDRPVYRLIERGNTIRVRVTGLVYGDQALWVKQAALAAIGGIPELPLMEDVQLSRLLKKSSRPQVLPTFTTTSCRRWENEGVIHRTLKNWTLLFRYLVLRTPARILAEEYQAHSSTTSNG